MEIPEKLSILVVGGHPADVFDCAGGTLAHHIDRGDRVTAVVMTHGARSHHIGLIEDVREGRVEVESVTDQVIAEGVEAKRDEMTEACALFGITDIRRLFYEDDIMMVTNELVSQIDEIIREVTPDIVITHHPQDSVQTHSECSRAVLKAFESAQGIRRGTELKPHNVAQLFFMGIPVAGTSYTVLDALSPVFCPVYVDVTDVIDKKVAALDKLKSQKYDGVYARKRTEANEGHFGYSSRVAYAEPFIMYYPEVYRHLPITSFTRQRAREGSEEQFARCCQILTTQL